MKQSAAPTATSSPNGHQALSAYIRARFDDTRSQMSEADERVREFAREKPFVALGLAVAAGFVIGRLLSRL